MYWVQLVGTHFSLEVHFRLSFVDFYLSHFIFLYSFFSCNGGSSTYIHPSIACFAQIVRKILIAYFLAWLLLFSLLMPLVLLCSIPNVARYYGSIVCLYVVVSMDIRLCICSADYSCYKCELISVQLPYPIVCGYVTGWWNFHLCSLNSCCASLF